jgi:hypothetical protein
MMPARFGAVVKPSQQPLRPTRATGHKYSWAITLPHRTTQSAPNVVCGPAVLLSRGGIELAEEQADHLLAAPISYSDSAI